MKNIINLKSTFNTAVENHQKNKLNIAYDLYIKILKNYPNHTQTINNLASIYLAQKNYLKAIKAFETIIKINPNDFKSYKYIADIYRDLKKYQKAIEYYKMAMKIDPNYSDIYFNLGIIFKILKDYQKALNNYELAININPKKMEAYNNIGNIYKELNNLDKAKNYYKKAIKVNPNYADAYNNLGVLYIDAQKYQKAKDCFDTLIKISPNYINVYFNLGNIHKELGELKIAVNYFKKEIELNSNSPDVYNNLGRTYGDLKEYQNEKKCYEEAVKIDPNYLVPYDNLTNFYIRKLDNIENIISRSYKSLSKFKKSEVINKNLPLFKFRHDVQQAQYLILKNYNFEGLNQFQKIGNEILSRNENKDEINLCTKSILLKSDEIKELTPFYESDYVYETKKIFGGCINPNKNWQNVEDEYLNGPNQIIYIDDFLSDEAIKELREFCLVSKVWNKPYQNKYLGAFSENGFISPIHLQIAVDLQQKLPKLFGPHDINKFWGFKYDSAFGKGINIHADFAIHNLNFWITPDKYNNNIDSGGLKIYDVPSPENWDFRVYNRSGINNNKERIHNFLKENNAKCINVPHKYNRAVLFNSAYFHHTDEIDFVDEYEGRRINCTYLFGKRQIK